MTIQQISVFIENSKGALAAFCNLLGREGIDLIALSIADTTDFGILRAIVADTDRALSVIRAGGYTANSTDVLAVAVSDKPGGLARVLDALTSSNISIEYLYSFVRNVGQNAVIIFRVENMDGAVAALKRTPDVRLLTREEVRQL